MGIKSANKFLLDNCSKKAIHKALFSQFAGKTIAIDTMIFIYKYESENSLIENMYLLISILRHYNITPVFIFDGKPPVEKKELLYKRRVKKEEAEQKYNTL
jgi:5'-3' exonuclease